MVFAINPAGFMETVSVCDVVPPGGAADSQVPPSVVDTLVVKARGAPLLVTWKVCGGGTTPPAELNVSEVGLTVKVFPPPAAGPVML